ncbi:MAG: hypothetical protein ACREKE_04580 [bacterium]
MKLNSKAFSGAVTCSLLVLCASGVHVSASAQAPAQSRYFRMCPNSGCGSPDDFVVAVSTPEQIQMAEDILSGKVKDQVHVSGRIVAQPAPYNAPWKFYLDPKTITFITFSHALCWDYSTAQVNANLGKVGTPKLSPNGRLVPTWLQAVPGGPSHLARKGS